MDEEEAAWNIRKYSATQLEKLSFVGGALKKKMLALLLPLIKRALDSREFLDREAGLLILGAITQREYESVVPALPELIPFILAQCAAEQQIAAWSSKRVQGPRAARWPRW